MNTIRLEDSTLREIRPNGGLVSSTAFVSEEADIDVFSKICDFAEIHGSPTLENTKVAQYAKVMGRCYAINSQILEFARVSGDSSVKDSRMFGTTEVNNYAEINDSDLFDNALVTGDTYVASSCLHDNCRVADKGVVIYADIFDSATIIGGSEVIGSPGSLIVLKGEMRIHEGVWHRSPFSIDHPDLYFPVTECVEDRVLIGCLCKTLSFWYNYGKEVLKKYGLPEEMYPKFFEAMDAVKEFKNKNGSPTL